MLIRGRQVIATVLPSLIATGAEAKEGETAARVRIVELLGSIHANLEQTRYTHVTRVDERAGRYEFDCSGMAAWVLRKTAPKAHGAVVGRAKDGRPLARDYYAQIAEVRPGKPKLGWSRIAKVSEAQAGDVIAWLKPKEVRSANTGHVAFLVEAPVPTAEVPGGYLVRIADASRYRHDMDTRTATGQTGFGIGTILVVADPETDAPRAYGWVGVRSAWVFETSIAIGRAEH